MILTFPLYIQVNMPVSTFFLFFPFAFGKSITTFATSGKTYLTNLSVIGLKINNKKFNALLYYNP